jgi:hypothetical protein
MIFLRTLGKTLLLLGFVALAYDGARSLANPGEGLLLTPISVHLKTYLPGAVENLDGFFASSGLPALWTSVLRPLLFFPASLLLGVTGAALFLAGYRKPPPEIVS